MTNIFNLFDRIKSKDMSIPGPVKYLIVGLGNPGPKYQNSRHNAGFMAIDKIAQEYNASIKKIKFNSLIGQCSIEETHCVLIKPSTFMNNSGEAVVSAMNFYKVPIQNVIVLYDDISLEPSKIRIRKKGSDGGHNGVKSIIYLTGEGSFPRIKIGVGKKPNPEYDLAAWVLSNFNEQELSQMQIAYENSVKAIKLIISDKIDQAMNLYNG